MFHDSISDKEHLGTCLHPPDESIQEQCERDAYDQAFDIYMRRRSGEIEALIRADEKLDAEWLAAMRRKADKLANIIRDENFQPKPVSIDAPIEVQARRMIRLDRTLGIDPGPDLKKIARGSK